MPVKEDLIKYGVDNGLWPAEAEAAWEACVALHEVAGKKFEDYPESFRTVATLNYRLAVDDWLQENRPKHFMRDFFRERRGPERFAPE